MEEHSKKKSIEKRQQNDSHIIPSIYEYKDSSACNDKLQFNATMDLQNKSWFVMHDYSDERVIHKNTSSFHAFWEYNTY